MKKLLNIILGTWCAVTCFISPIWLSLVFLNVTGLIYKYDYSMDEGTAGIIGFILLMLWVALMLLPTVVFIKKHTKYLSIIIYLEIIFECIAVRSKQSLSHDNRCYTKCQNN